MLSEHHSACDHTLLQSEPKEFRHQAVGQGYLSTDYKILCGRNAILPLRCESEALRVYSALRYIFLLSFFSPTSLLLQIEYNILRASSEKPRDLATFFFSSTSFPSESFFSLIIASAATAPLHSFLMCVFILLYVV
jgi:hypothetical protein